MQHADCLCDDIFSEALLCQAFDKKSAWDQKFQMHTGNMILDYIRLLGEQSAWWRHKLHTEISRAEETS